MTAFLKIIFRNFFFRAKRSFLTVLGIAIGATLILTLILLGEGLERSIASQLQSFGKDLIFISPGKDDDPLAGFFSGGEVPDDHVRTVEEVSGVDLAMGLQYKDLGVEYEGEKKVLHVNGSPWNETKIIFGTFQGFKPASGDWPVRDAADQVMLGDLAAHERFSLPVRAGDELIIRGRRFTVAGIFEPLGNPEDDSAVYMSLDRFRAVTGEGDGVNIIIAKAAPGADVELVADDIEFALDRRRGAVDTVVITSDNAVRIIGDVLGIVQLVLGAFAAVALVVGGVGIMNTMFTSVLERTREIGVMKAVGATDRGILTLFLTEAGLLGAIGGLLGLGVSYGLAKAVEYGAARQGLSVLKIEFDPVIVLGTLGFTFAVGVLFGVIPAWRASRLRPTEALRYE